MRKSAGFAVFFLLVTSSPIWGEELHREVARNIIRAELAAMKLPPKTPFCLALTPIQDPQSETAGDPSRRLLNFLRTDGLRPQAVSACRKALRGYVINIYAERQSSDSSVLKVSFSDWSPISRGEDLGVLHHEGTYEFEKTAAGKWAVKSYSNTVNEPPGRR